MTWESVPFVLLANVILLAQVDEVGDGFSGEELETVDDVDLETSSTMLAKLLTTIECRARNKAMSKKRGYERKGGQKKKTLSWAYWGVTPASTSWVIEHKLFFIF